MTFDSLLPTIGIICLAGFAQGLTGFGFGLIAMGLLPLLLTLNEAQALATLTGLAGCVALTGMTLSHVHWANVAVVDQFVDRRPARFLGFEGFA